MAILEASLSGQCRLRALRVLRLQSGLQGIVGGIGTKGVIAVVAEGENWKGARTAIRTDKNAKQQTEILPQIKARRTASRRTVSGCTWSCLAMVPIFQSEAI